MFDRGFKAWCERYSLEKRQHLGLNNDDPLDPRVLAADLGIKVWAPEDIKGLSVASLAVLIRNDGETPSCWSAVTIVFGQKTAVILNSSHSPGRQSSDLMHELSHRILNHETKEVSLSDSGFMLLSNYDKKQEEEADWLSGSLLLPREALLSIRRRGLDGETAARLFGVSKRMLSYRMSMTGVNRQYSRA